MDGAGGGAPAFSCKLSIRYSAIHEEHFMCIGEGSSFLLLRLNESENVHGFVQGNGPRCMAALDAPPATRANVLSV